MCVWCVWAQFDVELMQARHDEVGGETRRGASTTDGKAAVSSNALKA
jgi:hypothetical protein